MAVGIAVLAVAVAVVPGWGPYADDAARALASELSSCVRIVDPYSGGPQVVIRVETSVQRGSSLRFASPSGNVGIDLTKATITVSIFGQDTVRVLTTSVPIAGAWVWLWPGSISVPSDMTPETARVLAYKIAPSVMRELGCAVPVRPQKPTAPVRETTRERGNEP
jgi:ribosomal protein L21E